MDTVFVRYQSQLIYELPELGSGWRWKGSGVYYSLTEKSCSRWFPCFRPRHQREEYFYGPNDTLQETLQNLEIHFMHLKEKGLVKTYKIIHEPAL